MEEVIFFAVIIAMSVIDSIVRSRKAKRAGEGAEQGADPGAAESPWDPGEVALPTYDDDPSYDEGRSYDDDPSYDDAVRGGVEVRSVDVPSPPAERSSTELLAGDFLERLAGLADERLKGRMEKAQERPPAILVPRQSPPLPSPSRSRGSVVPRGEEHLVHLSHAGFGTDPSERARSEQDGLDPLAESLSADARAVRRQLLDHDPHSLRQALVLQEILSPPAALSNPRFYDDE